MISSSAPERRTRSVNLSSLPLRMPAWIGREHVEVDARYFRPAEVDYLCADASKAGRMLGWEPAVTFDELVRIMVEADIKAVETRLKGGAEALQFAVAAEGRRS